MLEVKAPTPVPLDHDGPFVFLAGTIDLGISRDWQSDIASRMCKFNGVILNPRRNSWSGEPDYSNPVFVEQVSWELDALERADIIAMNIESGSFSPVTMLEFGLHVRSGKVILYCGREFHRHGNVKAVAERYGALIVPSFENLIDELTAQVVVSTEPSAVREFPCPRCRREAMWSDAVNAYRCHVCQEWWDVPRGIGVIHDARWIRVSRPIMDKCTAGTGRDEEHV